ncbi:MAG: dihydropteroate synthase [Planctomycetota bacterium]|nr:dihydropteroate synthase [Planctomycetota bacterium]
MSDPGTRPWRIGPDRVFGLDRCRVMGILNVTADSFSDGGLYAGLDQAIGRAVAMVAEGADIVDVGGESTRPGAEPVDAAEQMRRVLPVIEGILRRLEVPVSIDTTSATVAEAAIDAGASIINDVSAGGDDPRMFDLAAARGVGLILMHRRCRPEEDSWSDAYDTAPEYGDVCEDVRSFLLDRARCAVERGVRPEAIVLDPGLGFGKSVEQNARLVGGVRSFVETGYPILCAASRKSFIGAVTGQSEPADRVAGSVAVAVWEAARGVRLFRVHDVSAHVAALQVVDRSAAMVDSARAAVGQLFESVRDAGTMIDLH